MNQTSPVNLGQVQEDSCAELSYHLMLDVPTNQLGREIFSKKLDRMFRGMGSVTCVIGIEGICDTQTTSIICGTSDEAMWLQFCQTAETTVTQPSLEQGHSEMSLAWVLPFNK